MQERSRFASFRTLMASVGLASVPEASTTSPSGTVVTPDPAVQPSASSEGGEGGEGGEVAAVTLADAQRGIRDAVSAERARWSAVLSSDEGRAHSAHAVSLLSLSSASSDQIVANLKTLPAAAPAPAAPAATAPSIAEDAKKIDLGKPANAAKEAEQTGTEEPFDPWAARANAQKSGTSLAVGGIREAGAAVTGAAH